MNIFNKVVAHPVLGFAAAASLVLVPAAVLAQGNNHGQNQAQEQKHGNAQVEKDKGPHAFGSTLEININDNGRVLVRGAKVTAVSADTISATTAFGSTTVLWTVKISSSTELITKGKGKVALSAVAVGDFVSFNGTLNAGATSLTVDAKVVKDWSKQQ